MLSAISSCAENARRISEMQDRSLSLPSRLALWVHLTGCRLCRRYAQQVRLLHRMFPEYGHRVETASKETLPQEVRRRIKDRLRETETPGP